MLKRCLVVFLSIFMLQTSFAACPQHTILDGILKTNVDKDGYVDYDAIRINKGGDLYEYISYLETADLKNCSEADKTAFWINAYNAHIIRLILARIHMNSINEDFALFGEKFKVANQRLSLNDIEHRVLRSSPKKGGAIEGLSISKFDPRIHFALSFGSMGSPKLFNRAYTGNTLESALQSNAVAFANNSAQIRIENDTLFVNSLLRWYADDFTPNGGAGAYMATLITPKLRPDDQQIIDRIKTDFPDKTQFRFDWTLNSVKNKK